MMKHTFSLPYPRKVLLLFIKAGLLAYVHCDILHSHYYSGLLGSLTFTVAGQRRTLTDFPFTLIRVEAIRTFMCGYLILDCTYSLYLILLVMYQVHIVFRKFAIVCALGTHRILKILNQSLTWYTKF